MVEVSAAILHRNGKFFIAKRPEGKPQANLWEFPGGKAELGETAQECLKRELQEELSIDAIIGDYFMTSSYDYEFGTVKLNTFLATTADNCEIISNIHTDSCWVSIDEFKNYELAPVDIPVVTKLKNYKF